MKNGSNKFFVVICSFFVLISLSNQLYAIENYSLVKVPLGDEQTDLWNIYTKDISILFYDSGYVFVKVNQTELELLNSLGFKTEILDTSSIARYYLVWEDDNHEDSRLPFYSKILYHSTGGRIYIVKPTSENGILQGNFTAREMNKKCIIPEPATVSVSFRAPALAAAISASSESEIQAMMNKVSTTTLYNIIYYLQNNPTQPTQIGTRRFVCSELATKGDWIYDQFQAMGLQAKKEDFNVYYSVTNQTHTLKNIVATLPGIGPTSDGIYILGAHYDSTNKRDAGGAYYNDCGYRAPGANDNASGVAAVLETARAMVGHRFRSTIKFIAFTGEENSPHYGSQNYTNNAVSSTETIKGMISADMVGYNPPTGSNPNGIGIWGRSADSTFCDKMVTANTNHSVGMTVRKITNSNNVWSDHYDFQVNGFIAATNMQDVTGTKSDFTIYEEYPHYHYAGYDNPNIADTIDKQTFGFLANYVKLCVATFSDLAVLVDTPTITGISPSSATIGTQITINGTGFESAQSTSTVKFYNNLTASIVSWSDTQIVCTVPNGTQNGNITVNTIAGASNGVYFTILIPPQITSLNPNYGLIGTTITITGNNFGYTQNSSSVTFYNNQSPTIIIWSDIQILCWVPANAQTGPITVTTSSGTSNGITFTVNTATPTPTITSLIPNFGEHGSSVTIYGINFGDTQNTAYVKFQNNRTATINSWGNTQIVCIVPNGVQNGNVTVTTLGGTSNGIYFTVSATTPTPQINNLNPVNGIVGTTVTITGTNFGSDPGYGNHNDTSYNIKFGTIPCTETEIISWSTIEIKCFVPNIATGTVTVTVTSSGIISNSKNFEVKPIDRSNISGIVTDSQYNMPLSNVILELKQNNVIISSMVANPNGSFRFDNLTTGDYQLVTTLPNYLANTTSIQFFSTTTYNVTIKLDTQRSISGYLQDTTGIRIGQTLISLGSINKTVLSDGTGSYYFGGLPEGVFELTTQKDGYYPLKKSVSIFGISKSILNLTLEQITTTEVFNNLLSPGEKTRINFFVPSPNTVTIKIYDIAGGLTKILIDNQLYSANATAYNTEWNGTDNNNQTVPSGIYFVHIRIGVAKQIKKVVFIR